MADELAEAIRNAGALFIGSNAATAFGDYVTGSNHVLPTGGAARYAGALSVATFRRRMAEVKVPDAAVGPLAAQERRSPAPKDSSTTQNRWRRVDD